LERAITRRPSLEAGKWVRTSCVLVIGIISVDRKLGKFDEIIRVSGDALEVEESDRLPQ